MALPMDKINGLKSLVGNTPLIEIELTYKGEPRKIYAKLESYNFSGSIKDRMAYAILKKSYENGTLKEGDTIVEATSGNTGISFCALGRALGHKVIINMPDWLSRERYQIIESLGAEINLVSKEEGGFLKSIEICDKMREERDDVFLPHQFSNCYNTEAHYETTGPEIWQQIESLGLKVDAFTAGVGTGGTVMGTGKYLKEKNPEVKIHPLEPSNSPTLTTGYKVGAHRIQGISDEFIPEIVKLNELDDIIQVDDGDSILMAQKLSRQLGLAVGISCGANFLGALIAQNKLGKDAVSVTVFSDSNKKYLSTDYMKEENCCDDFYSQDVELIGFKAVPRTNI